MVIRKLGLVVMVTTKTRNERAYQQAPADTAEALHRMFDRLSDPQPGNA